MESLTTQHCLAIAAAFIAIIAACATLINSANNKAEFLVGLIHKAAEEHRERKNNKRCRQLQIEVDQFKQRFLNVQKAQRLLFFTIGIFIISLAIFLGLGLYATYLDTLDKTLSDIVRPSLQIIGVCVVFGTVLMLWAIALQFSEVGKSYRTLCVETADCNGPYEVIKVDAEDSSDVNPQAPGMIASSS